MKDTKISDEGKEIWDWEYLKSFESLKSITYDVTKILPYVISFPSDVIYGLPWSHFNASVRLIIKDTKISDEGKEVWDPPPPLNN